jgi:hypothetical protein
MFVASRRDEIMKTKLIAAIALLALTLTAFAPLSSAQVPQQEYELTVTNPVVFLASTISGNVSGPDGTYYKIVLVNMTSYEAFTIGGGIFNSSIQGNYSRYMNPDFYPAGRYTLNLTVEEETVLLLQVTLVYDQVYVFWKKITDIVEELTSLVYRMLNAESRIDVVEGRQDTFGWVLFLITLLVIIGSFGGLYFILLPVMKAHYARGKSRTARNQRLMKGLDCDPNAWADLEPDLGPEDSRPNLNPIPQILMLGGISPALARECLYDAFGRLDMAVMLEKDMSYWEKKKIAKQKKAKIEAVQP